MTDKAILCVDDEAIARAKQGSYVVSVLRKPWDSREQRDLVSRCCG